MRTRLGPQGSLETPGHLETQGTGHGATTHAERIYDNLPDHFVRGTMRDEPSSPDLTTGGDSNSTESFVYSAQRNN